MAGVTGGVATVFKPELWIPEVMKATEDSLVAAKATFDVSGFGEVKSKGDVIHVPHLSNYTAGDKTAGTEIPESATTETESTLTISTHKALRIPVEDIARIQSGYDLMSMYTQKIGFGLAKALDTSILSLWSGLSQTIGAAATDTAYSVSYTNIVRAARYLDGAIADPMGRCVILDEYGLEDLRLIDKFVEYDSTGLAGESNPMTNGKILAGRIFGMPVHITTNLQTTSVVGGTIANGLVIQREAFFWAKQTTPGLECWRNAPRLQDELISQILYGAAEYRDDHGVVLHYGQA